MITVGELIDKLKAFDPSLPVAVADWQECYLWHSNGQAGLIKLVNGKYAEWMDREALIDGPFVQIGEDIL